MSNINTKDFTSKASRRQIGKRNSGAQSNSKDQLNALKVQKKELKAQLKAVEKQENSIKKQISKSKTTTNNKKISK
jgi:hypothetical protein